MRGIRGILLARTAPIVLTPAYANTLTPLVGSLYAAMNMVSRELVGFLPSVTRNSTVERAAVGQSVNYPIAPASTAIDVVPAMQVPEPRDQAFTTGQMAITKSRKVEFGITGEETRLINSGTGGPGFDMLQAMWVAEALRTLVNEMEADLAAEAAANASRATGTPGTTPFATDDLSPLAQLKKILDDNGAPRSGRSAILDTAAAANLITVKNLSRVNEAGTSLTLRNGELLDIYGLSVKDSAAVVSHATSTAAGATTNASGYAIGAQVITLAAAGTGNITPGEVISFAGDANKYVVIPNGGDADVSNGGTITIAAPGLRQAIPAAATAITKSATYRANVAFSQDAMAIAMRAPALPPGGDIAVDRMTLTDPYSGISFEFAIYPGYRKMSYEVSMAWGVKAIKRNHIALLQG